MKFQPIRPFKPTHHLATYAILVGVTVLLMLPPVWLIITSLKKNTEYLTYPIQFLPAVPQWGNYLDALTKFNFFKYARNSIFLATTYATLTVITSAMAGFAFARFRGVPGRTRLFSIVVSLLIIPATVTQIPQFVVFARLNLTNTYWPWILWGLTANAFHIFMFRQFFATFPRDLEEAAEVDGAGPFRIFWQIFLPNAKPVLATSFIFNFSTVWGDYITPLLYLNDDKTTLAVKLASDYVDPKGNPLITTTLAAAVIYTLPLIAMFILGQRHILKGIVTSGLKG